MNQNHCYYKIELLDGNKENINANKIKNFILQASKGRKEWNSPGDAGNIPGKRFWEDLVAFPESTSGKI